jgi:hypothetical protein
MEIIDGLRAPSKTALGAPYSSPGINEHTIASSTLSQPQEVGSPLPSSSVISTTESTFSPGSSPPNRGISISSSVSEASFHSCTSKKGKIGKEKIAYLEDTCLQCASLGLRCSFSRQLRWKGQFRSTIFCRRCEKSGERFCIRRNAKDGQYCADGADECEVKKRVEELLEPKRVCWKWCLPKIPPGTRASLRRVWPQRSET